MSNRIISIKKVSGEIVQISFPRIKEIVNKKIELSKSSLLVDCKKNSKISSLWNNTEISFFDTYPNAYLLPLSFAAAVLSWDYFEDGNDINDALKALKRIDPKGDGISELESKRTRKYIVAGSLAISAILNTVFVFQRVKIITKGEHVGVSLAF